MLHELWDLTIHRPLKDISTRPRKKVRGSMVRLGALLTAKSDFFTFEQQKNLDILSEAIELIHLGSLIIDDVQDGSEERRGGPTVHLKYGVPIAVNLGSLLFFEAISMVTKTTLNQTQRLRIYEVIHKMMVEGHKGQALDISRPIDLLKIEAAEDVCLRSLDLKAGELMALALKLGVLAIEENSDLNRIHDFGVRFGRGLQMLDDCGNLQIGAGTKKHLEDLVLRRPSWIWVVLGRHFAPAERENFSRAVDSLPDTRDLGQFLERTELEKVAYEQACLFMNEVMDEFRLQFHAPKGSEAYQLAHRLAERLCHAYQSKNSSHR